MKQAKHLIYWRDVLHDVWVPHGKQVCAAKGKGRMRQGYGAQMMPSVRSTAVPPAVALDRQGQDLAWRTLALSL